MKSGQDVLVLIQQILSKPSFATAPLNCRYCIPGFLDAGGKFVTSIKQKN